MTVASGQAAMEMLAEFLAAPAGPCLASEWC